MIVYLLNYKVVYTCSSFFQIPLCLLYFVLYDKQKDYIPLNVQFQIEILSPKNFLTHFCIPYISQVFKERVYHQSKLVAPSTLTWPLGFIFPEDLYFESNSRCGVKKWYSKPTILVIQDHDLLTPGPRSGNPGLQSGNPGPEL